MNYTNKHGLDEWVCRYLAHDDYDHDPNVISATTLIEPARAWALKRKFADDLEMDYSDMIALRNGSAIHAGVEKSGCMDGMGIQEERFYSALMGFTISGKMDMVIDGVIADIKTTSVWKIVSGDFSDYVKQLSIYKWLLSRNGMETADYGYIHFFFTDWKKADALKGGNYPPIRYAKRQIELWSVEETEKYIGDRLTEFVFAESALPECTSEELWQTESTYAVYKKLGQARAAKVCKTEAEANEYIKANGGEIQYRPGKVKRCGYCTAAPFCEQFNKLKEAGLIDD